MPWIQLISISLVLALISACAGPQPRAYDPSLRGKIKTIGVLTPGLPDEVAVRIVAHPGQSLGVIGYLVSESDMRHKTAHFTAVMAAQGFHCRSQFGDQLMETLKNAGYQVRPVTVFRHSSVLAFLDAYPDADGSVDAYLDLYAELIGYVAAGADTPYRPTVQLHVRLVRAKDHKVLYQDVIAYNAFGDGDGAVTIPPSGSYGFRAFGELMAAPVRAAEGLRVAMDATGRELARQLR